MNTRDKSLGDEVGPCHDAAVIVGAEMIIRLIKVLLGDIVLEDRAISLGQIGRRIARDMLLHSSWHRTSCGQHY